MVLMIVIMMMITMINDDAVVNDDDYRDTCVCVDYKSMIWPLLRVFKFLVITRHIYYIYNIYVKYNQHHITSYIYIDDDGDLKVMFMVWRWYWFSWWWW
jgi:hypothetical protein